jgi:hypothetical protein
VKGQLLDLRRYSDGSFRAFALGETDELDPSRRIDFASGWAAQEFISQWYQPLKGPHG